MRIRFIAADVIVVVWSVGSGGYGIGTCVFLRRILCSEDFTIGFLNLYASIESRCQRHRGHTTSMLKAIDPFIELLT